MDLEDEGALKSKFTVFLGEKLTLDSKYNSPDVVWCFLMGATLVDQILMGTAQSWQQL